MHRSICIALLISLPLAGVPVRALASPPEAEHEVEAPADDEVPHEDPVIARARELFDAGVACYSASDYQGAIEFWTKAYALLPPTFDNRLVKADLIYNIARAQQQWFDIDHDVKHLRQAREILGRYLDEIDDLYPEDQVALEQQKVEEQIAGLDEAIAEVEAEAARREAELAERMRPKFDEEADARDRRRNRAMLGAGAGLSVVGLGAAAAMSVGIVMTGQAERAVEDLPLAQDIDVRQQHINRGRAGNALTLLGSLIGGVFLAAGVPLIGVGLVAEKRRKQRRREAGLEAGAPMLLPGGGGLVVGGRF